MDHIDDLLEDTDEQLALVGRLSDEAAESGVQSRRFKPRIKNVLENQRSILDYLANAIHSQYGTATKAKIYYPFASKPQYFKGDMESRMPGVQKNRPDIAQAIKRHQPFNQDWMVWLSKLRNEHGHVILTKHTRQDAVRTILHLPGGGTSIIEGATVIDPVSGKKLHPSVLFKGHTGYTDVPIYDWQFPDPPVNAYATLFAMQYGLKKAVMDVRQTAGL